MVFNNKIKSVVIEFFNSQNVDVTRNLNLPFSFEPVLDETLATAKIILSSLRQREFEQYGVRIDRPFEPNTPVVITFEGQQTEIRMLVARDTAEMVRKDTPFQWWRHEVELVEETKKLERIKVDSLVFQNLLPREYDSNADTEWSVVAWTGGDKPYTLQFEPPALRMKQEGKSLTIPNRASTISYSLTNSGVTGDELSLTVTFPSSRKEKFYSKIDKNNLKFLDENFNIELTETGEYTLSFYLKYTVVTPGSFLPSKGSVTISAGLVVGDTEKLQPYTLSEAMERMLSVTPLRQKDGTNKYTFENSEGYSTEEAPEFSFTDNTLFEACLQVAQYKQSFPFLYKNQISFRPLWNGKTLKESSLPPAVRILRNSSIDQYCTNLDCTVENMVCINDVNVGTVIEPYAGGYISTRSSAGSEISETTAMIPTQSDI